MALIKSVRNISAGLRPSREKLAGDGGREDPVKEIKLLISC